MGVVSRRWVWLVGMGEIYGCVSRRWVWVESMGVVGIYGCGCKEVYRFPHITYPYSSLFFSAASLLFVHFLNVFRIKTYSHTHHYHVFKILFMVYQLIFKFQWKGYYLLFKNTNITL